MRLPGLPKILESMRGEAVANGTGGATRTKAEKPRMGYRRLLGLKRRTVTYCESQRQVTQLSIEPGAQSCANPNAIVAG